MLTATAPRTCPCGTVLSQYNPGGLCSVCARQEPTWQVLDEFDLKVLNLLLTAYLDDPDRAVDVLGLLRSEGVQADCWMVGNAVNRIRWRTVFCAEGVRGTSGYRIARVGVWHEPDRAVPVEQLRWEVAGA